MAKPKQKFNVNEESEADAKVLGNRKKFTTHDLVSFQPKTENQKKFLEMYYSQVPVIACTGSAGVGKTAVAFYAALTEVFDESTEYEQIIMVRSAVETRKQGFLPGELALKNEPYEAPYKALTEQFVKYKSGYEHLKALGYYQFLTTSYLRGITLDNSIVICEEFQNYDYDELSTLMTRLGINSRIIFTGDDKQNDLKRQREKSGYSKFLKVLDGMPYEMVGRVQYTVDDVVRSGVVKSFLIADAEYVED